MVPIAVPTLPGVELFYRDYKTPLEPLEGGHGYVGVLLQDAEGRLLCHVCGRTFVNLGQHARRAHGMDDRTYKREQGLLRKSVLIADSLREVQLAHAVRRGLARLSTQDQRAKQLAKGRATMKVARTRDRNGKMNPEYLNKTGRCYEQVKAVIQTVVQREGKLTEDLLNRAGVSSRLIQLYFGSLTALQRQMNVQVPRSRRRPWREDELLDLLRSVAASLERSPSYTDLKRYGLPDVKTFARRWGSWQGAIEAAGFARPETSEDVARRTERIRRHAAILRMNGKTHAQIARVIGVSPSRIQQLLGGMPKGNARDSSSDASPATV